jgi:hypothetical protein
MTWRVGWTVPPLSGCGRSWSCPRRYGAYGKRGSPSSQPLVVMSSDGDVSVADPNVQQHTLLSP